MKFFKNITNIAELKTLYKKLALQNHPDMGGSEEIMKDINAEYDIAFNILSDHETVTESASSFRSEFYTQHGWKGENYQSGMYGTDVAVRLRKFLKTAFPKCRFSVTSDFNHIKCRLMKADFNPFSKDIERKYIDINQYFIGNDSRITDFTKTMFTLIDRFIRSYRYDYSDSSVDYFNTNFYYDLGIGKWNKEFIQTADHQYSSSLDLIAA